MPDRLFHYQRFVEAHLVSLLVNHKIKLSRADAFNDPWDCRVHYQLPSTDDERNRVLRWLTEMHRKHHPSVSEAQRALLAHSFRSNPVKLNEAIVEIEKRMYATISEQYRVYCLSEKVDSALMWAHYTGSHKGICLEFDATIAPFTRATGATPVEYRREYPAYDLVSTGYEPLVTKSADWAYEAEWRLIAEERGQARAPDTLKTDDDFMMLPEHALKSVTIGCLADDATRSRITQLIRMHAAHVIVRQAEVAIDRYELIINPPVR